MYTIAQKPLFYFEVKAFKGATRRFENLDNIDELNQFVDHWSYEMGYNKFVIKSFDSNGYRKTKFVVINEFGKLIKLN